MKNSLLILGLFLFTFSYAQELQFEKGKVLQNDSKLSNSEIKTLYNSNPKALEFYTKSKEKGAIGGILLGLGSGLVLTDLILGSTQYNYQYPKATTFIGIGAIVVSIPVLSGRRKLVEKSVEEYNNGIKNTTFNNDFELNIVNNSNGFGLQISF